MYSFAYSPQALAYLRSLQPKYRKQIIGKISALAERPYPPNSRVVRGKMDGKNRILRIRSGVYRVLYSVREEGTEVIILDVDHRKDVYR